MLSSRSASDGVDLVDEHDAGGLLLGLAEQVAHLGGAHAHEHLHKFRAGHGEKGHVGFAGHRLGQHGLAGARRAYQQDALGHGRADGAVFAGVVEIVHHLGEALLGLVLAGHIGELDALGGLHIHLGVGFAEGHGVGPAGPLHQLFGHVLPDGDEHGDGQHPAEQKAQDGVGLLDDLAGEFGAGLIQPLRQVGVGHHAGLIDGGVVLVGEEDLVFLLLHLHLAQLTVVGHPDEGAVIHFADLPLGQPGHREEIEQHQHEQHGAIVEDQWFFRLWHFLHGTKLLCVKNRPAAGRPAAGQTFSSIVIPARVPARHLQRGGSVLIKSEKCKRS